MIKWHEMMNFTCRIEIVDAKVKSRYHDHDSFDGLKGGNQSASFSLIVIVCLVPL